MDSRALFQAIGFALMMFAIAAFLIKLGRNNKDRPTATWLIFYTPAIVCILIGLIAPPALYHSNAGQNASTLAEGDMSIKDKKTFFTVEHPGVEHTIEIWPTTSPISTEDGNARIKITDTKGQTLLDKTFDFSTDDYGSNTVGWKHEKETFTPSQPGKVVLQLVSMSGKFSDVHLWVKDPKKTNGKRD